MRTLSRLGLGILVLSATSLFGDGATLAKKCASCHGASFEKKALNKSQVVKGWKSDKVVAALQGYKAGTYGGTMKGLMKGQVISFNDAQIKELADYIESLK